MFLQDEVVVPRPLLGHETAVTAENLGLDFRRHLVGAAAPGWRAACKEIRADDLDRYIPLRLHAVCELAHDGLAARILQVDDDNDSAGLRRQKRQLAYANRDSSGQLHEGIDSPCRLEYDAAANCYDLIIWQADEARAIKMRVARLESVQCLDAPIPAGTEASFQQFLASRRQSVTLRIERQNNAVERSFMMFASYDKEASYDEDTDTYTMQLYGAAATVLAPAEMREAIIERLKAAWQNLQ